MNNDYYIKINLRNNTAADLLRRWVKYNVYISDVRYKWLQKEFIIIENILYVKLIHEHLHTAPLENQKL